LSFVFFVVSLSFYNSGSSSKSSVPKSKFKSSNVRKPVKGFSSLKKKVSKGSSFKKRFSSGSSSHSWEKKLK